MAKLRVAIIGAGGAGLSMCRCLADEPQIDFVAFEKSHEIGGVWQYTKDNKECVFRTPMYKNLRTNLPKEVMRFPEFPFPEHLPSFMDRESVVTYLNDYAEQFDLLKHVKLQHEVISVKPCQNEEQLTWQVVIKDLKTGGIDHEVFDAVVVCNGHFSVPNYPEILGLDNFPGTVLHSIDYKVPEAFKDQTVVVLGARSSGTDISMEVSKYAKKVYLVHLGERIPTERPENVEEIIGTLTSAFSDGSVEISNECKKASDAVIFCTGYKYSFPFLTPECKIEVQDNRITSLYKHVFSTAFPSLSFVGLCLRICPFPQFVFQARWITSVLTGRKVLPSREEMVKDEEMDFQERLKSGVRQHQMHSLGSSQWKYNDELSQLAGVATLSPAIQSLYEYTSKLRFENLTTYRDTNFSLKENEWHEIKKE